ncbi:hypothetical protein [Helcococcus kunzii]|uniref:hypothetical protein n=1 Tax=Helcococcus kunzii TaxID=40091 RepID=UPI0038A1294A
MKELELQTQKLVIKKIRTYTIRNGRQVRVLEDTYDKIKKIADDTGRNIGDVSEMIMAWAIDNVVIEDE